VQLNGLHEEMVVCDEKGQTLGHFLPADIYRKLVYAPAEAACPLTREELERRRGETGARPLAEIWQDLGVK
jgi:hypothetical protein